MEHAGLDEMIQKDIRCKRLSAYESIQLTDYLDELELLGDGTQADFFVYRREIFSIYMEPNETSIVQKMPSNTKEDCFNDQIPLDPPPPKKKRKVKKYADEGVPSKVPQQMRETMEKKGYCSASKCRAELLGLPKRYITRERNKLARTPYGPPRYLVNR